MPKGAKRRGCRYSSVDIPLTFCTSADCMKVAGVLYLKWVPGLWGTGWARKDRADI